METSVDRQRTFWQMAGESAGLESVAKQILGYASAYMAH